jgi:hypothetical protein
LRLEVSADLGEDHAQPVDGVAVEHVTAVFFDILPRLKSGDSYCAQGRH